MTRATKPVRVWALVDPEGTVLNISLTQWILTDILDEKLEREAHYDKNGVRRVAQRGYRVRRLRPEEVAE